jgi:hypothetical protein
MAKTPPPAVRASPILQTQVWSKMHNQDNNWMGAVVGDTGLGKSFTCLSTGEAVDPNFSIDQVAFNLVEFMRLVMDESYGRGSMIVLEEASVEAAAEDFHEISNKVLRTVLETWREQNRGALLNLPTFSRLDKGAKIRMSALIQQRAKFEDEGYSVATFKNLQTDSDSGTIYRHYPRINGREHRTLKIAPPSDDLIEAYQKKKSESNRERNKELLEELLEEQREADEDEKDPQRIADEIMADGVEHYVDENNGQRYISRSWIELDYDLGKRRSKKVKAALKRGVPDERLNELLAPEANAA